MNSKELMQEFIRRAKSCQLAADVLGDGSTNAEIAVVAEAPGEREVALKMPLVGGSGKFLWEALRRIGVTRQQCYVTNVVKRQLYFGPDTKDKISANEFDAYANLVQWELEQLPNLKYVFLLGDYALRALTGEHGIERWRGSCVQRDGRWYIITNNPAHIIRSPSLEPIFALDIHKLKLVINGEYSIPHIEAQYDPSPDEAIQYIERMHDEKLPVAIDIETIGGETACVGLTNSVDTGMCINFRDRNSNRWNTREELDVRLSLSRMLSDNTIQLVAQNGVFDAGWLYFKDRIRIHHIWFDTLLAHHTLYPTLPHDLGFLTAQYTHHPYYKDEIQEWREGGNISTFWEYNVKDCCITLMVQQALHRELQQQKLADFFFNHVMRLQPHLVDLTACGVRVDVDMKERLNVTLKAELEQHEAAFYKAVATATGDETFKPNPSSPKQIGDLLFNRLRVLGKGSSTNRANRTFMLKHPRTSPEAKECILALNRYAEERKFLSTYINTTLDDDNRIRTEYKQSGTQSAPGRLSSSKTLWGSGMNMQNQPSRARPMYVADPGFVWFYFDLSQAEARVVAYEANIPKWKEQFERARRDGTYDCHRALAAEMYAMPYDDVPTADVIDGKFTLRYIAKRCRHGLNYRMMAERLAEVTGMSLADAERNWHLYHRTTPELRKWWRDLETEARTTKMLFNAMGRRLYFLGPITEDSLDALVAFKPQSLIGDKVCKVIYMAHDDPQWPRTARILINVHDSLSGLARPDDVMRCLQVCKRHAEEPLIIKSEPCIIPADCAVSEPDEFGVHRWSNLKKTKVYVDA